MGGVLGRWGYGRRPNIFCSPGCMSPNILGSGVGWFVWSYLYYRDLTFLPILLKSNHAVMLMIDGPAACI